MEVTITKSVGKVRKYLRESKSAMICDIETTAITVGKGNLMHWLWSL